MLLESDLIPFAVSPPPGNKAIVLAPHPDDETLGCGGTIRLLLKAKKQIKVVFLTSGDKADPANKLSQVRASSLPGKDRDNPGSSSGPHVSEYALLREKEAVKALGVLGVSDYEFLRFPDRELRTQYKSVFERLLEIVEAYMPDTIYSPSVVELNPDHRTTAALALDIQRGAADAGNALLPHRGGVKGLPPAKVVFYEVTTPLRPNVLVDITPVYGAKKKAISRYVSQLKLGDYLSHITAMNTIRALTVKNPCRPSRRGFLRGCANGPRYVEAFWSLDQPMSEENVFKWLSYR
jgi:LmbE family N-acetylglucosaminyl deacetylase